MRSYIIFKVLRYNLVILLQKITQNSPGTCHYTYRWYTSRLPLHPFYSQARCQTHCGGSPTILTRYQNTQLDSELCPAQSESDPPARVCLPQSRLWNETHQNTFLAKNIKKELTVLTVAVIVEKQSYCSDVHVLYEGWMIIPKNSILLCMYPM